MKISSRTTAERAVQTQFEEGAYQAIGCCSNPRCESPQALVLVVGRSPRARVCLICFEFEFDCKHPSSRRIATLKETAKR